jgi:hypothetical protein
MYLEEAIQKKLRALGKISNSEVLMREGDLFVVLNVVTQQRRIIPSDDSILEAISLKTESSRKILKG